MFNEVGKDVEHLRLKMNYGLIDPELSRVHVKTTAAKLVSRHAA
jgi:hypothetical protein